jgi:D-alanyl-D-alanine carboxypeptidase
MSQRLHGPARRSPSLVARLNDLSHNKPLLILTAIGLVALLTLIPVLINAVSSHNSTVVNNPGSPSSGQGSSTIGQQPLNPREIVIVPPDTDHPPPPVFANAAYVLDADTGVTLYAHNPFMHLPILSTTKLMTGLLAVERGNLDQQVKINNGIWHDIGQLSADSSLFGIKQGETYTLRELLYGLLLPSGNDAAVAIADTISGSVPQFVTLMNQRAHDLGMLDTHYMNPHGLLQTGHYSSAHDLALLGRVTMNNATIRQISGTRIFHMLKTAGHPERFVLNGNQFLWWYPGVDGGKPGFDGGSNFNQVISCTRNGHHLIGVTLHTSDWWTDMRDLLNWGFNDYHWISPYDVDFQHPIPYDNQWNYFARDKKTNTIPTPDNGRYYIYSGYSIAPPLMTYFDQNGGLDKFGYPTGQVDVSRTPTVSQKFEKATIQCDLSSKQCKAA